MRALVNFAAHSARAIRRAFDGSASCSGVLRARWSRFERACFAFIVLGLATRLLVFWYRAPQYDAEWYMTMGKTLLIEREFTAPWLPTVQYTQHFPPAFPALLAIAFAVGGTGFSTAAVVSVLVACFLIGVTFFTTRDLYGRTRAFAVTAVVATFAALARFDAQILSESLVAAFFALTVWGIVKSVDKPRLIVVAGVFAGLGYLTKASMGPFFLLAGAGGFAWRFYYVRFAVFRDKWYVAAAAVFALFVLPWAARNVIRHGSWETQAHASDAIRFFFTQSNWLLLFAQTALWGSVIIMTFALPFFPEIRASFRRIREQKTSALWLAVVTPTFIALIFAAAFGALEDRSVIREDVMRYLVTPIIPLLWLGMRDLDYGADAPQGKPGSGAPRVTRRAVTLSVGVAIAAFFLFTNPVIPYVSTFRFGILIVGTAVGLAFVLASRSHMWSSVERSGSDGARWRAVPALPTGPHAGLAILAFGFAVAILVGVAYVFFALLVPAAISLAAGSNRARVLVLCACTLVAPLAHFAPETTLITITDDVNRIAAPGSTVLTVVNTEFYVYPQLRSDLVLVTDGRPFDYYITYFGADEPIPGYHEVANETRIYRAGPGTAVGLVLWGTILGDQDPVPVATAARLFAANATT